MWQREETYAEKVARMVQAIATLNRETEQLRKENAELDAKLAQNTNNPQIPTSRDPQIPAPIDLHIRKKQFTELDLGQSSKLPFEDLLKLITGQTKRLNLNNCYWLKPTEIVQLLRKANGLQHLHVVECQMDSKCVATIANRAVTSLSISYDAEWRSFLCGHIDSDIICFQNLKNFEVFRPVCPLANPTQCPNIEEMQKITTDSFICELFETVLHHCEKVRHLKVWDSKNRSYDRERANPIQIKDKELKILPALDSIDFDLNHPVCKTICRYYLKHLISWKVPEVTYVHLRSERGTDLVGYNIYRCLQLKDVSTLIVKSWPPFVFEKDFTHFLQRRNLTRIVIDNINLKSFKHEFRELIINNKNTLQELCIFLDHLTCEEALFYLNVVAYYCSKVLKVLDLKVDDKKFDDVTFAQYKQVRDENYQNLFKKISKLSNLEYLSFNGSSLQALFGVNSDVLVTAELLEKMLKDCSKLEVLKITNSCDKITNVSCQMLNTIRVCHNLKTLYIKNVLIRGKQFNLANLTKNCPNLEQLFLINITTFSKQKLDESLKYTNKLKVLSLSFQQRMVLSESFVTNLKHCTNLERFSLGANGVIRGKVLQLLAGVVCKLKSLHAIVLEEKIEGAGANYFVATLNNLHIKSPFFCCKTSEYNWPDIMPEVHLDL